MSAVIGGMEMYGENRKEQIRCKATDDRMRIYIIQKAMRKN